jgi:hypothetical protein
VGFHQFTRKISIDDAAIIAVAAVQKNIEVYTQDAEWDLEDLEVS